MVERERRDQVSFVLSKDLSQTKEKEAKRKRLKV